MSGRVVSHERALLPLRGALGYLCCLVDQCKGVAIWCSLLVIDIKVLLATDLFRDRLTQHTEYYHSAPSH